MPWPLFVKESRLPLSGPCHPRNHVDVYLNRFKLTVRLPSARAWSPLIGSGTRAEERQRRDPCAGPVRRCGWRVARGWHGLAPNPLGMAALVRSQNPLVYCISHPSQHGWNEQL